MATRHCRRERSGKRIKNLINYVHYWACYAVLADGGGDYYQASAIIAKLPTWSPSAANNLARYI